jgi:formiminotetrahydrofolate cyclodeaminase
MTDYSDLTLEQYRDALASDAPTPGGGTAAAVALSQGAALAIMVCNLTLGKEKWNDGWKSAEDCKSIAEPLLDRGHELAGEDAEAFDRVMSAYKMPKSTDDEADARRMMIREETLNAAIVPMETARLAFGLLKSLPSLASSGNANAVTDVGVAGLLVSAACKGALFNVEINLNSLPEEMASELRAEMESLRLECRDVARNVMHSVHDRM